MSNVTALRHPAGIPTGGQFAAQHRPEADVELDAATEPNVRPELNDTNYLGLPFIPPVPGFLLTDPDPKGGFDEVVRFPDGTTGFTRRGFYHRSNGPAVFLADGSFAFYLNGEKITPPDQGTGAEIGLCLRSVSDDGTQQWASASGEDEALVLSDGTKVFYHDGELHRDGGPAIILPDGSGQWAQHGTFYANPIPAPPTVTSVGTGPAEYVTTTGSKYDEHMDLGDVAKAVRADLKLAVAAGAIPSNVKVSVTQEKYSMGQSLNVRVSGFHRTELFTCDESGDETRTADQQRMTDQLEQIVDAYRKTTTDRHTDYWNASFDRDVILIPA